MASMRVLLLIAGFLGVGIGAIRAAEQIDQVRVCGAYTLETYRTLEDHRNDGRIVIRRGKEIVYEKNSYAFSIGRPLYSDELPELIGQDLTASGHPHVVICEWTGGAHGAHIVHVLRLGAECTELATINGLSTQPEFVERTRGEPWEIQLNDPAFEYWPYSFAASPFPKVVLRWNGNRYVVALDRMAQAPPSTAELAATAARLRSDPDWLGRKNSWRPDIPTVPPELYTSALDLMYSGHEALGWRLLRDGWGGNESMYLEFISGLKARLAKSEYWPQIPHPN